MDYNGRLFCGQNDQGFAIDGVTYKWPINKGLTWSLGISRLGPLSDLDLKGMYAEIFADIATICDFEVTYTSNWRAANFLAMSRRLDGPSNVLAQSGIPMPHYDLASQVVCDWDDSEAWGLFENPPPEKIDAYRTGYHETLHGIGLGHGPIDPRDPALIEPRYNALVRRPQRRDKIEMVRRYGPPKSSPSAPTPVTPTAGDKLIVEELRVFVGGKRYTLKGSVGPMQLTLEE